MKKALKKLKKTHAREYAGSKKSLILAAGIILAVLAFAFGCSRDDSSYNPAYTSSSSYSSDFEDPEIPTNYPVSTDPVVSPLPLDVPELTDSEMPSPTAGEYKGLAILSFTKIVAPDGYATLTARGKPGVEYNISVIYYSGPSKASGLVPKTAGEDGKVSWTWHVGPKTREGEWEIIVTGGDEEISTHFIVMK